MTDSFSAAWSKGPAPAGEHDERQERVEPHLRVHAVREMTQVVRVADEGAVDHILEQVEVGSGLDPDAEQVVYELGDWPEAVDAAEEILISGN